MARYTGSVCRQCRRENMKLFLKGDRCHTDKCAVERRNYAPGQHGQGRIKVSDYGTQLREKQRVKRTYGLLEKQFRLYFEKAENATGITGENLLRMLEMRLDNVIYRLGFADSLRQARQLVRHGHFSINERKTDIPSCAVKPGDMIAWKAGKEKLFPYQSAAQNLSSKQIPGWLSVDATNLTAKVLTQPSREDIGGTINERLIVEFYSK